MACTTVAFCGAVAVVMSIAFVYGSIVIAYDASKKAWTKLKNKH